MNTARLKVLAVPTENLLMALVLKSASAVSPMAASPNGKSGAASFAL